MIIIIVIWDYHCAITTGRMTILIIDSSKSSNSNNNTNNNNTNNKNNNWLVVSTYPSEK